MLQLNMFESEEESRSRQLVLSELDDLIQEWVSEVSLKQVHIPGNALDDLCGRVVVVTQLQCGRIAYMIC